MEFLDKFSDYLDDLRSSSPPLDQGPIIPFEYCGIPEELRQFVIEKVNPPTFGRLSRTSQLLLEECSTLPRKPFVAVPSIRIETKGTKVVLKEPGYVWARPWRTRRWADITSCGYRFAVKKIVVKTTKAERLEEMLSLREEGVASVERIVFPVDFEVIPFQVMSNLIQGTGASILYFTGKFSRLRLIEFCYFPQVRTLVSERGGGISEEEFLSIQQHLEFGYGNTVSLEVVGKKIEAWKKAPITGGHFTITISPLLSSPGAMSAALLNIGATFIEQEMSYKPTYIYEMACDDGRHWLELKLVEDNTSYTSWMIMWLFVMLLLLCIIVFGCTNKRQTEAKKKKNKGKKKTTTGDEKKKKRPEPQKTMKTKEERKQDPLESVDLSQEFTEENKESKEKPVEAKTKEKSPNKSVVGKPAEGEKKPTSQPATAITPTPAAAPANATAVKKLNEVEKTEEKKTTVSAMPTVGEGLTGNTTGESAQTTREKSGQWSIIIGGKTLSGYRKPEGQDTPPKLAAEEKKQKKKEERSQGSTKGSEIIKVKDLRMEKPPKSDQKNKTKTGERSGDQKKKKNKNKTEEKMAKSGNHQRRSDDSQRRKAKQAKKK